MKKSTACIFSGALWLFVGTMLLIKGVHLLLMGWDTVHFELAHYSLFFVEISNRIGDPEETITIYILVALFLGILKGRFVLRRTALQFYEKIKEMEEPLPFTILISRKQTILIAIMMSLGFFLRVLTVPCDLHGAIDIAVGIALVQGAATYFSCALMKKQEAS